MIKKHLSLKSEEIMCQIEEWCADMVTLLNGGDKLSPKFIPLVQVIITIER